MADKESVVRQTSEYTDIMEKNHMEIPWHDYAKADSNVLIAEADLIEKASVIGQGRTYDAFLWNRCLACTHLYESVVQRAGSDLYRGCWTDVHRV